jgi:hypothetical protein
MSGGGSDMRMGERAWVGTGRDQTGEMGHINMQIGAYTVSYFAHFGKINLTWHG